MNPTYLPKLTKNKKILIILSGICILSISYFISSKRKGAYQKRKIEETQLQVYMNEEPEIKPEALERMPMPQEEKMMKS